jgi:hypothetical protein
MQLRKILLCCVLLSPNLYAGDPLVGKQTWQCHVPASPSSNQIAKSVDPSPRRGAVALLAIMRNEI